MDNDLKFKYVALLDILGFKDISDNNTHEELSKIYEAIKGHWLNCLSFSEFIKTENGEIHPNLKASRVNSMMISDTIVFWTEDTSALNFFNMVINIRCMLNKAMWYGLPMRGCMTSGNMSALINNVNETPQIVLSSFYGKTISDAYAQSNSLGFSGAIITEKCLEEYKTKLYGAKIMASDPNRLDRAISISNLLRRNFLKEYSVPFSKEKKESITINWVIEFSPKLSEENIKRAFVGHGKKLNSQRRLEIMKNTLDYWNDCPGISNSQV